MKTKLILIALTLFTYSNINAQKINWISIEQAEKLSKKEPKKIYVKLQTSWCGWCKKMDKETFSQKEIIDYINENFYAVKLDGEDKRNLKYKGRTFKFVQTKKKRRSYNELSTYLTTKTTKRPPYPSHSIIDEKGEVIEYFSGYFNPQDFLERLSYYNDNVYKIKTWKEYSKK